MQITLEGHPEPVPVQAGDTVLVSRRFPGG
jgi:hypothetical protein